MIRRYFLPIMGGVLNDEPLQGNPDDPLSVIPINELPNIPTKDNGLGEQIPQGFAFTCLNYDVDKEWCEVELDASQEVHDWLIEMLPRLKNIAKQRNWKLDKTELQKIRLARLAKEKR